MSESVWDRLESSALGLERMDLGGRRGKYPVIDLLREAARLGRAQAEEIARLREVVEPLANVARIVDESGRKPGDDWAIWLHSNSREGDWALTVGDCRRALRVLARLDESQGKYDAARRSERDGEEGR